MSISTIEVIRLRIDVATPKSPIAVFKMPVRTNAGHLEAVFGSTIDTHRSVEQGDPMFVGYFHNGQDKQDVIDKLREAAGW